MATESRLQHGAAGLEVARKDHVCVAVRFRPLSDRERERGDYEVWNCSGNTVGIITEESGAMDIKFAYDHVFPAGVSNQAVYQSIASSIVKSSLDGISGTIFAYGVTSSGKTHTMMGDDFTPGIVPHAVADLFDHLNRLSRRKEFKISISMLEIYNEVVNDLLDPMNGNLKLREDPRRGIYIEGITEDRVRTEEHARQVISTGNHHRKIGATAMNEGSSRSHTIIRIGIEANDRPEFATDPDARVGRTFSYLTLVDLAGSESARAEINRSQRMEGSFINKSLLTLGTVINKLSEGGAAHIPFRDSKLTRILSNSLTGNGARIAIICTITPASTQAEETHNTLKFAGRAKRIAIEAKRNEILDQSSLIARYQQDIALLQHQNVLLQQQLANGGQWTGESGAQPMNSAIDFEIKALKDRYEEEHAVVVESERENKKLEEQVERLTQCVLDSHAALGALERRLRLADGEQLSHEDHESETAVLRRQVVALADELRDRERSLRVLADTRGWDLPEEDMTLQVMFAEREYMKDRVEETGARNEQLAIALERLRRVIAASQRVSNESIDLDAIIAGDMTSLPFPETITKEYSDTVELGNAAAPLRKPLNGNDRVLAERVIQMEEKVEKAITELQRKEELIARHREMQKVFSGLHDQVYTNVADLTAENSNLKKELSRVENQLEQLQGYNVDNMSQPELYELIRHLTEAVERVRVTVVTKKIALQALPAGGKPLLSPERRVSRGGMSIEDMGKAIEGLKSYRRREDGPGTVRQLDTEFNNVDGQANGYENGHTLH